MKFSSGGLSSSSLLFCSSSLERCCKIHLSSPGRLVPGHLSPLFVAFILPNFSCKKRDSHPLKNPVLLSSKIVISLGSSPMTAAMRGSA